MTNFKLDSFLLPAVVSSPVETNDEEPIAVSVDGRDVAGCGRHAAVPPCRTLAAALANAADGQRIRLNATSGATGNDVADWLCGGDPLVIRRSVTIEGVRPATPVGCDWSRAASGTVAGSRLLMFNITGPTVPIAPIPVGAFAAFAAVLATGNGSEKTNNNNNNGTSARAWPTPMRVGFRYLTLVGALILAANGHVELTDCTLVDSHVRTVNTSAAVRVDVRRTTFRGRTVDACTINCTTSSELQAGGVDIYVDVSASHFHHSRLHVYARRYADVRVDGCTFDDVDNDDGDSAAIRYLGGVDVTVTNDAAPSSVRVRRTVFARLRHNHPVMSVMNILDASILVRMKKKDVTVSNFTVVVDGCRFADGERGMTFVGAFRYVNVSNSRFEGHVAMHAGAALLYLSSVSSPSFVVNCTFENNAAGFFRPRQLDDHVDSFQVIGLRREA